MSPILRQPGHRMSSLPVVQYCGMAGVLGSMGSGRAAAQGSVYHAYCSGDPRATEMSMRLTADELAEIMTWKKPIDVDLGSGRILRYADAEKELEVALDRFGSYCPPDSPKAVTIGHLDFAWKVDMGSLKIAYVADLKRSEFTVSEGTDSLQLHAYGLAYATKHECDGYAVGIWAAIEGRWQWSDIVDLESAQALSIAKRVVAAATNTSTEYAMGPHCRSCYGRARCPAWLLPPDMAGTALAPVAQGGTLTHDNAVQLLLLYQRFVDTAKAVEQELKAFAVRTGGIRDPKSGKVWRPVVCQGRESVSVAAVRKAFGEAANSVITQGKPYEQFKWVNQR